ncbi:MAG: divalent-cation tolerance protein CutA [Candidatus Binataceae bacterium]
MPRSIQARLVLVTAEDEEQARKIAHTLVDERLAACVNILGPLRSVYLWQGAVHDEREQLLLIKSRAALYSKLERRIKQLHSYETPEIIAVPIAGGLRAYLDWIFASTNPRPITAKSR